MRTLLLGSESPSADSPLRGYVHRGGYPAWAQASETRTPERLIDLIEESGLTGKGGAGYPAHKKMRLMLAQSASRKTLVVNGSEHEPGSLKDRYLLEHHPHRVIEGALLAAHAAGATEVLIAINEGALASLQGCRHALQEAHDDPAIDFKGIAVSIGTVPDAYIVGEESALLEVLEGNKPLPRKKPPFPIQQGLHGRPTLIHNVETVAHLPFIAAAGAAAYRALGATGQGITLCTLGEEFARPGVYEVPLGTPIREILERWGGGLRDGASIKAIQPGGPSSGFLVASQFDLPLDAEILKTHGSSLGCAVVRAYSVNDCMVREVARIMHFFAAGCCGQCPRCRMETNMLDTITRQILAGRGNPKLLEQVDKIIALAQGEGICGLISMPVAPVQSCVRLFADEFTAHFEHRCPHCAAGASVTDLHGAQAAAGSHGH